eukprot:GHVR01146868.1.p1 GENE.GHVR01146868.1~~GHVR01146868.1.p1  ORF type:complete len:214 (-),score=10.10 GHVR01146868.1:196-837(-)
MANVSRIFGLRPTRFLKGAEWNGQSQLYGFAAAQANNAYVGDLVTFDATNRSSGISDPYAPGIPLVAPVVTTLTTNVFRGVIAGFIPAPEFNMTATASLGLMYRQASTLRYTLIVDDIDVVFEAQELLNAYVTALDNAVNKTSDITYTAGSQITGVSGVVLNTPATSGVKPLRINRYTQRPDNFNFTAADASSYAHFDVTIANSDMAQAQVGA